MLEVYATTPEKMSLSEISVHAQRAERMGYDGLHVPDAVHDGLLMANNALLATERLKVGTGVLVAFSRSPMNVAIAAWDLSSLSNGRFELGLGTQIKQNIEERYSSPWSPPVKRMREYIESLRAIFDAFQNGTQLNYLGENYRFTRLQPFFNPGPIPHPNIPMLMGAVGPIMTQLAGELADGMITHPTNTPPRYVKEVCLPRLQRGADKAGHNLEAFKLMLCTLVATGPDQQSVQVEREKQRRMLGFLFSTPAYWPSLALFGWEDRGHCLQQLTRTGDWSGMAALIDDEILDQFVPCGTYSEIVDLIKARYAGLSTRLTLPLPEEREQDSAVAELITALKS